MKYLRWFLEASRTPTGYGYGRYGYFATSQGNGEGEYGYGNPDVLTQGRGWGTEKISVANKN